MKNLIFIGVIFLSACAHIPKETMMLSDEMGVMISAAREANVKLLDQYQASRIERVDEYMQSTWIPRFIENMAKGGDLWGKVCKTENACTKTPELQGFVLAAARKIAEKRKTLTDTIDEQMAELRAAVAQNYDILALSNQTVTDNLRSARMNDEVLENSLKRFNIAPEKMVPAAIRELDEKLNKLMD